MPLLALRLAIISVLIGLLVWPPLTRVSESQARQVRRSDSPPSIEELERLERIGTPLYAARPSALRVLVAATPARSLQNRATSIAWQIRAEPGAAGVVRIADATGPFDSAMVIADSLGAAVGAFRALPTTAGWQEWTLSWEGATARTGAWVLPERPLRALVVSGPASVEGRDVSRALESTGVLVTLAQSLGRGLALGDSPASIPSDTDLARYDVVLVLGGITLTPAQTSSLTSFAAAGGGVLAAGEAGAALPIARRAAGPAARAPVSAVDIEWATPAEVTPLPGAELEATAVPLALSGPATFVAARASDAPVLLMAPFGRGRMAALALENTWIWGLQAGRGAELAAFWRGLADWLDGGARAPFAASADPVSAAPGSVVSVEVARLDPAAARPAALTLVRPDGSSERLPLAWQGAVGHARFVPSEAGTFLIGDSTTAGTAAGTASPGADGFMSPSAVRSGTDTTPSVDAWARLALLANATGGEAVPAESLDETLEAVGEPRSVWPLHPLFWLAAAVALALLEWTTRRLGGLA